MMSHSASTALSAPAAAPSPAEARAARRRGFLLAAAIGLVLAGVSAAWFAPYRFHALMGDDLELLAEASGSGFASSFTRCFTYILFDKYRPVAALAYWLEIPLLGNHLERYQGVNLAVHWVNVCLVALLAWRLSGRRGSVALLCGVLFACSRLSYFHVLQVWGLMESLALWFMLLALVATWRAWQRQRPAEWLLPVACYALASCTHERYLVLGAFLTLALWLAPRTFRSRRQRLAWAALPALVLAGNLGLKTLVFRSRFFTATRGPIEFDLLLCLAQMRDGFLNMIGFNIGPPHYAALDCRLTHGAGLLLALGFALPLAGVALLFVHGYVVRRVDRGGAWRALALFLALYLPLLASASVLSHQEFRWLYPPYAVFLLGLAALLGGLSPSAQSAERLGTDPRCDSRPGNPQPDHADPPRRRASLRGSVPSARTLRGQTLPPLRGQTLPPLRGQTVRRWILVLVLAAAGLGVDHYYRRHIQWVYFIWGQYYADSAKANMIDAYGPALAKHDVYLLTLCDATFREWYFYDQVFFQVYRPDLGAARPELRYVTTFDDLLAEVGDPERALVFTGFEGQVRDVTQPVRDILRQRPPAGWRVVADLVAAKTNAQQVVEHYGPLGKLPALRLAPGASVQYDNLALQTDDVLYFLATAEHGPARVWVSATSGGTTTRLLAADLAAPAWDAVGWQAFRVPRGAYAGEAVTVSIGMEARGAAPPDTTVAISRAQVYRPPAAP